MRRGQTFLGLLAVVLTSACGDEGNDPIAGGQSGGMVTDPGPMFAELVPCACQLADHAVAVTATLESADACESALVVDEVVGGDARGSVAVGDVLVGRTVACVDVAGSDPGDAVLAFYMPPVEADDDAGVPPSGPVLFFVPLGSPLVVAPDVDPLPASLDDALSILLDLDACKQWFEDHHVASGAAGGDGHDVDPESLDTVDTSGATSPADPVVGAPDCGG